MNKQYDLVVVGTGITSAVATRCREAGWSVAVIDRQPFGGTCALRGCVPKKILVSAADAVQAARDLTGKGVPAGSLTIDWPELMRFKRSMIGQTTERTEQSWARMGVEQFHGLARFVGPTTLAVGSDRLTGRHIVLAAGSVPVPLRFPGAERLITSDRFLDLDRMPPRVLFVGGGYISFEFAHVAARAGAQVMILHRGPRPLERFDPDLVDMLVRRSDEARIRIRTELDFEVRAVDGEGEKLIVRGVQQGEERRFATNLAVHGAGRVPDLDDLDLDAGGVKRDKGGIVVNQFLQSVSNPAVYAGGDAAANGPALTPKADHDVGVLTTNLLEGNKRSPNYEGIASAVFTIPPLASVGLSEDAARKTGRRFKVNHQDTAGWFNTRRVGETAAGFKVLIDEESDQILGAHLLGPRAEEVINLFAVAIRQRIPARELKEVICAYPTFSSDAHYML